jgi:type VI secretion system protein VasG
MIAAIIRLQLGRIASRVAERHRVAFSYDEDVVGLIAARCTEPESGGRMIDAILTNTMLPEMSRSFLERMLAGESVAAVRVKAESGAFAYEFS